MTQKKALKLGYIITRGANYGGSYVGSPDQDNAKLWYIEKIGEQQRRFTGYPTKGAALAALDARLEHARNAGSAKSETKAAASRLNGTRGGRSINQQIAAYMSAHQCSRSTAYRKLTQAGAHPQTQ